MMSDLFATVLARIEASPSARFVAAGRDDRRLLIVMSPLGPGFLAPSNFFGARIRDAKFDMLQVRDTNGLRYLAGLEGLSTSLAGTMTFFEEFIHAGSYHSVCVLGPSAATHAVFVAGCLLELDAAICLGCRFDLRPETRPEAFRRDGPAERHLRKLWATPGLDQEYLFARNAAEVPYARNSLIRLYYDPAAPTDRAHARMVEDLPFVTSIHCCGYGHNTPRLAEEVFATDPLLGGQASYHQPTRRLEDKKLITARKLQAALAAAGWGVN